MREVIYNGPKRNLGRHGVTGPGTKLMLDEDEFKTVVDNPDYEVVNPRDLTDTSFPQRTDAFDLRTIDWSVNGLTDKLRHRTRHDLQNIGKAMNLLGASIIVDDPIVTNKDLAESISEYAHKEGWHLFR